LGGGLSAEHPLAEGQGVPSCPSVVRDPR
jgi:hypothetical protein